MSPPIAYGIDFGTSNSAISVAYPDEAVLVPLGRDETDVMPSIVYLDASRQRLAGDQAVQQYLVAGSLRGTRIMSSLKSFLADLSWDGTQAPWGEFLRPEDLVAVIIADLKRQADRYTGKDVKRVVLGHPALFVGVQGANWKALQELAKKRLESAARIAGFTEIVFADESEAAVTAAAGDREGVLVGLDFGGGTFDVSVIEINDDRRELLSTHGAAIGGERFDSLLFDGVLASPLGLTSTYTFNGKPLPVPAQLRKIGTLHGALDIVGDDRALHALADFSAAGGGSRLQTVNEIVTGGHGYRFFRAVEQGKIDLSASARTVIRFKRPRIDVEHTVTRERFSELIAPDLDRIDAAIAKALDDAGVKAGDIDTVARTGGSSQIPAFVTRVSRRFGPGKCEQHDALATVALGLGLIAGEVFA